MFALSDARDYSVSKVPYSKISYIDSISAITLRIMKLVIKITKTN